jgi:hypothetical protein
MAAPCLGVVSTRAADEQRSDTPYRLLVLGGGPVRWAAPKSGLPPSVSYAFLDAPQTFDGARNCGKMLPPAAALAPSRIATEDFRREVRAAFRMWHDAVNIEFHEVSDPARAGILIGAEAEPRGRAFTNVATRAENAGGGLGEISRALICLNPQQRWKIGFDGDLEVYDLRYTIAHEIGHAIGLDHPGPEGQLMSFRYVETSKALRPGDVAGAEQLYGPKAPVHVLAEGSEPPRADPVRPQTSSASHPSDFALGGGDTPRHAATPSK